MGIFSAGFRLRLSEVREDDGEGGEVEEEVGERDVVLEQVRRTVFLQRLLLSHLNVRPVVN